MYRLVCAAEWLTFRAADMSLATNESFREIAMGRGGMKPDRVVVVQTCAAIRDSGYTLKCSELKQGHKNLVVYVGHMAPQDGVDLLLQSIRYVLHEKQRWDTLFLLIGSGPDLARLRNLAKQQDLSPNVRFTGPIVHSEVGPYIAAADVCVAPDPLNPHNDKCSMIKIFEYMAYAKPIVLYDLKEGRRSAADAALYARPDDAVDFAEKTITLLDSAVLRKKLGQRGRKRVQEGLNWEIQSRKLVSVFDSLLSSTNSIRPHDPIVETEIDAIPARVVASVQYSKP